ncbi:MAG: response regulator transcription factor [Bacteroidaceae bacterium]|nr:response regulator transcription factor [Bacteroidaceae bacterium]
MKIAILDDRRLFEERLERILEEITDVKILKGDISANVCEMLEKEQMLDLLVLDINTHNNETVECVKKCHTEYPNMRILMVAGFLDSHFIRQSVTSGVHGFILRTISDEQLRECLKNLKIGKRYICQEALDELHRTTQMEQLKLTRRETEVLRFIVDGLSIKMIADRLNLSFETVHSYSKSIKMKLGVKNTAALVRVALEQRLIEM